MYLPPENLITWPRLFACTVVLTISFLYSSIPLATPRTLTVIQHQSMKSAFKATRLTNSTYLVKEYNDVFSEHPHIYVKIVPSANTVLVIDTGTGGRSNDPEVDVRSLREFIEIVHIPDNDDRPLNEGGRMKYVVITTHCHYDHILGVEQFNDSVILASGYSKAFLSPAKLPEHSLCAALGIKTPQYTPKLVPHGYTVTSPTHPHVSLNVTLLHTPGHTPDELAIYDADEMMLYVGDSLYENEVIIFPNEGSITRWFDSMNYLMAFVDEQNRNYQAKGAQGGKEVLINAGHQTVSRPAMQLLSDTKEFMDDVIRGKEPVKGRLKVRGEDVVVYERDGGRFSLRCPEKLVLEARRTI